MSILLHCSNALLLHADVSWMVFKFINWLLHQTSMLQQPIGDFFSVTHTFSYWMRHMSCSDYTYAGNMQIHSNCNYNKFHLTSWILSPCYKQ